MAGIRVRRRTPVFLAAVAALVGSSLAVVTPAAAEGDPVITLPVTQRFNPATTPYTVTTSYDGPEFLYVVLAKTSLPSSVQALPSHGSTDLDVPAGFDGDVWLTVRRCPTEADSPATCAVVAKTWIYPFDEFVGQALPEELRGPSTPFAFDIQPTGGHTFGVAWEVVPDGQPDAVPLLSGTSDNPYVFPALGDTDALVHGERYQFRAEVSGIADPYGSLDGNFTTAFEWDGVNAARGVRLGADVVYPERDPDMSFGDQVTVDVVKDEPEVMRRLELDIRNSDGVTVRRRGFNGGRGSWDGKGFDGFSVPEGNYSIHATVIDRQGNEESYVEQVRVSHEILAQMIWGKTIAPRPSMIDRFVGRCASLESPARAGWRGSIGLRSNDDGRRCRTLAAQSVTTVHDIQLPPSPLGRRDLYDQIRVSAYGGGARGSASAYLVHWYWHRDQEWFARSQLDRRLGWHRGHEVGQAVVHGDAEDGPYLIWSVGLAEGSMYDVKKFKVRIRYWGLRRRTN